MGDKILGDDNEYHSITGIEIRKNEQILTLELQGVLPISSGGEHQYLSTKKSFKKCEITQKCVAKFSDPEWTQLKNLSTDHYIGVPVLQKSDNLLGITEKICSEIGQLLATPRISIEETEIAIAGKLWYLNDILPCILNLPTNLCKKIVSEINCNKAIKVDCESTALFIQLLFIKSSKSASLIQDYGFSCCEKNQAHLLCVENGEPRYRILSNTLAGNCYGNLMWKIFHLRKSILFGIRLKKS